MRADLDCITGSCTMLPYALRSAHGTASHVNEMATAPGNEAFTMMAESPGVKPARHAADALPRRGAATP
jgi:hypothetical protein